MTEVFALQVIAMEGRIGCADDSPSPAALLSACFLLALTSDFRIACTKSLGQEGKHAKPHIVAKSGASPSQR